MPAHKPCLNAGFDQLNFFSEKTNWQTLEEELGDFDWKAEFRALSPKEMLSKFLDICYDTAKTHVPLKKREAINRGYASKIPRERKNFLRKRSRINKQISKTTSQARRNKLLKEAREIEKRLKQSYTNDREINEHRAVNAISRNSKYFFSHSE